MSNDLLRDLQKLSGAIDRHKGRPQSTTDHRVHPYPPRSMTYTNPNYQTPSKHWNGPRPPVTRHQRTPHIPAITNKEITIGGVSFNSSKNKLTRKDAPLSSQPSTHVPRPSKPFRPSHRGTYRPRGGGIVRNRTLKNSGRQPKSRRIEKQCPFFTKTGTCARGKKCPYQHDPEKIAICPRFLHNDCPFSAETCQLSHDPTPNRTPLCIHFANSGRCKNGNQCVYPHFNVGTRVGVCKDFAVLGYCEKGTDCEKQHIKECPAFAETGNCNIKNCKLPHVIRASASRQRKPVETTLGKESKPARYGISFTTMAPVEAIGEGNSETTQEAPPASNKDTDYIPLTFEESDEEEYSESNSEFSEEEGVEESGDPEGGGT